MSKTQQGSGESRALPAQRPVTGLFFLCSFLLLVGIPASSYVEIWAKACLNGGAPGNVVTESGSMTMQRYHHYHTDTKLPDVAVPARPVNAAVAEIAN